ncbi:MAG TPA: 5'/3'-nucleotidase SurE [Acidimicrobiales bacterium]|nr:5'/3'-nucleotidase SurE [Acidimicrobiales bacterium]
MARVLVTNDDGVHAPGILALATALAEAGHHVTVVAPLDDRSGSGAALGPGHASGLRVERLSLDGLHEVPVFGLDGPPGMCVMAAHLGAFGERPEIIASGINLGGNTGRSILFSGTVGAALAAANFGLRGIAVSQSLGDPWQIGTGAAFGVGAVAWALERPTGSVLNVNVPNLDLADVRGVRSGRLAPFGVVRTVFEGEIDGRLVLTLRETDDELDTDTDTMLVNAGYVSVNALVGPRAVDEAGAVDALAGLVS